MTNGERSISPHHISTGSTHLVRRLLLDVLVLHGPHAREAAHHLRVVPLPVRKHIPDRLAVQHARAGAAHAHVRLGRAVARVSFPALESVDEVDRKSVV